MRHWLILGMMLPAVGLAGRSAAVPPAPAPQLNSCHGGECSWSVTRSRAVVRQDARGTLYRLSLLGGSAREGSRRIRWNRQPHEVFIFCSRRLPAVILAVDNAWQVDVLDFVNGPPPVLESSAELYVRTCHPGIDWATDGFARRFGYRSTEDLPELQLTRPEDIFRHAH
jgi:hypothetical protein